MSDLVPTTTDALAPAKEKFDIEKSRINDLINEVPESVGLRRFETSGSIIPWNDHNVTGKEINQHLVSPLQEALENSNKNVRKLYEICTQIYVTIGALDKDYIAGIVGAVNAATVASNQALTAWNDANLALGKAEKAQTDIKRTIEVLQAMVNALNRFKDDVKDRIPNERELAFIHRDIAGINANLTEFKSTQSIENDAVRASVREAANAQQASHRQLERKLKISYIIGGVAVAFSLAQMLLSIIS